MSRFRRALAATAMAVAAAGGGLLIAAAGSVPAYASATSAPAAAAPGAHTVIITAHPAASSGIGPHTILPCAQKPGAEIKPMSCNPPAISCVITAGTPFFSGQSIIATADTSCTDDVTEIQMLDDMLTDAPNSVPGTFDDQTGTDYAFTQIITSCQAGHFSNSADALITFPPGYVLTGGSNPIHQTSASITIFPSECAPPPPGGPGGGGGGPIGSCAVHAPSSSVPPARIHPHLHTC